MDILRRQCEEENLLAASRLPDLESLQNELIVASSNVAQNCAALSQIKVRIYGYRSKSVDYRLHLPQLALNKKKRTLIVNGLLTVLLKSNFLVTY